MIYEETKHRIVVRNADEQRVAKGFNFNLHPYDEHLEMLNRGETVSCWCLTGRYVVGVEGEDK